MKSFILSSLIFISTSPIHCQQLPPHMHTAQYTNIPVSDATSNSDVASNTNLDLRTDNYIE